MFESKYNNFLTVLLIVIIIAIVGLLGFLGFTYYKNYATKKGASDYVDTFSDGIGEITEETPKNTSGEGDISGNLIEGVSSSGNTNSSTSSLRKKKVLYNGFEVLGTIEIPKTNVKYPILARVTKNSLENSVAVLYPQNAELNTPGNVVIIGHNYRNGLFFSNNKKLSNGDKVYITDLSGNKVVYVIYNTFETSPEDTSFYNRDTNGAKEITLSTCNDDTSARLIIEARAE